MWNPVESLVEVKHDRIDLLICIYAYGKVFDDEDELWFEGPFISEAMLLVGDNVVFFPVLYDLAMMCASVSQIGLYLTGSVLAPFLNTGVTRTCFQSVGTASLKSDAW